MICLKFGLLETIVVETGFFNVSFRLRRPPQERQGVSDLHISSVHKFLKYYHTISHIHTFTHSHIPSTISLVLSSCIR